MSEHLLVSHCAPTLAGLKTANLFSCACPCPVALMEEVRRLNTLLNPKGVFIEILCRRGEKALVYVYRPKKLASDLSDPEVLRFLQKQGYRLDTEDDLVAQLGQKLFETEDFPHEIGLFLGYPFEDVRGFIENKGCNCKLCGYWKVYANEWEKKRLFDKFSHCRGVYCRKWQEGRSLWGLTVAC